MCTLCFSMGNRHQFLFARFGVLLFMLQSKKRVIIIKQIVVFANCKSDSMFLFLLFVVLYKHSPDSVTCLWLHILKLFSIQYLCLHWLFHVYHPPNVFFLNLLQQFWPEELNMKRNKPNHQMKAGNICEGSSLLSGQNQYQKEERKQKADNVKQPVMKK